jgi:DNA-binding NtrC family response regulator
MSLRFMFLAATPMRKLLANLLRFRPRRRGTLRTMQNAAQFHSYPSASGLALVETDSVNEFQVAGVSAIWRKLLLQVEMAAPHVQVASVEGEQGSGKQTLARYLLSRSQLAGSNFQRRDAREWLLEHEDPSALAGFTYLDRVDLLGAPGQGLLLRVLKRLQDRPLGRSMLVASSQSSLRQMAGQGLLLPDLAFRLTAVRFAIPPLRMRKEDISPIAQALLERICARYQHRLVGMGPGVLARLLQHSWPGNIRELASALESGLLDAVNDVIRPCDLALANSSEERLPSFAPMPTGNLGLDDVIHHHVQYVLDLNRGIKLRAARQLGISRSTLYRILGSESILTN